MTPRPSTPVEDRPIPRHVATALQAAFGSREPPATLGDWADTVARLVDENDVEGGFEALCTAESSRHRARIGDDVQHFHCVLDTLLLPFVVDDQAAFAVDSRSPISDEVVEIRVSRDGVDVTPADAVMSFGVDETTTLPADAVGPEYAYDHLCPYVNAFASREEYERWAAEQSTAATMAVPLSEGFDLAAVLEDAVTSGSE